MRPVPATMLMGAFALALSLGACDMADQNAGPRPLADAAEGSNKISDRHFSRITIPCQDPQATARALLEITRRDLGDASRVQLLDHASDAVRLKEGEGRIAVIVYSITNDGEEASVTTTEHFLINDDCRVMHWGSAVSPAE